MKVTKTQFIAVMSALREVGYTCLGAEEQAILDAFDEGRLDVVDMRSGRAFGEPPDEEFDPEGTSR